MRSVYYNILYKSYEKQTFHQGIWTLSSYISTPGPKVFRSLEVLRNNQ